MTLATDMYYSGFHPNTGKPLHIPKDVDEKAMQRALLQPHLPAYRELARTARRMAGAPEQPNVPIASNASTDFSWSVNRRPLTTMTEVEA